MHKSFINFRYIRKYTNGPVVFSVGLSFFCVGKTSAVLKFQFWKNTNGNTIIIVLIYNWSKNIYEILNVFSWSIVQLRRFFSINFFKTFLLISQDYIICSFAEAERIFSRTFHLLFNSNYTGMIFVFFQGSRQIPVSKSQFVL